MNMRTLRLALAGVAMLALLGVTGGASVAQEKADLGYAAISGTAGAGTRAADPAITTSPTVPQEVGIGMAYVSSMRTNDWRLSGRLDNTQDYYGFLPGLLGGAVRTGSGRLTNEGGSWLIEFQGFTKPETHAYSSTYYVLHYTGEDGYEGLSAMTIWLPTRPASWDVEGVLFPGEMPPMPALPAE